MSLLSDNPYKRIFIFENSFTFESKDYYERFYYLIKDVEYDSLNNPVKVDIKKILFIESYIKKEFEVFSEITITDCFDPYKTRVFF